MLKFISVLDNSMNLQATRLDITREAQLNKIQLLTLGANSLEEKIK